MTTEDYCSFELSKLLKEKGFKCGATYKDVTYIGKSGDTGDYSTYEEAVEAALKYCLTELI